MAVDTENKRRSVVYILPVPDSDISLADRQQVAYIYSGILVNVVSTTPQSRIYNVPADDRVLVVATEENIYNIPAEDRIYEVS